MGKVLSTIQMGRNMKEKWEVNLKHGLGIFTFEDGTTYHGPFEHDRMVNRSLQGVASIDQEPTNTKGKGKSKSKEKGGKFVASNRIKKEVE